MEEPFLGNEIVLSQKAMNPSPDGKMPNESQCSPREIQRYLGKISGPLLDRIDMHVEVPLVPFKKMTSRQAGEDSASIRERVSTARSIQETRFKSDHDTHHNAAMDSRHLKQHCALSAPTLDLLRHAMEDLHLSARAYDRILKVARTIADLAEEKHIDTPHIAEAIQYRSLDRQLWA